MNEQELCKKRLLDLSKQADRKNSIIFSDFLNLNELNIYHTMKKTLLTDTDCFGGYENAERQMIAFIPDALSYEYGGNKFNKDNSICDYYPIRCVRIVPKHPKYAEKLSHRDLLGALMSLGIERSKFGDILCFEGEYYIFCLKHIFPVLLEQLSQVRHTEVVLKEETDFMNLQSHIQLEECFDMIASNRIDCIIAKACHVSRSEATALLSSEKVFINGKTITNGNVSCSDGSIISVRGKTRFVFESCNSVSKKGKLRVKFSFYK